MKQEVITMGKQYGSDFYTVPTTCQILGISQMITDFIGNKTDGVFIEVGGNDGETFGCTAGLADMGWKGYYIEPLPEAAKLCYDRHLDNNVNVIECAVGKENGKIPLYISSDKCKAYTTTSDVLVEHNKDMYVDSIIVNMYTLDDLLEAYVSEPIDILVIDTEGTELDVLKGFTSLKERLPRMLVIEANNNPEIITGVMDIVSPEYTLVFIDSINMILCLTVDVERYQGL